MLYSRRYHGTKGILYHRCVPGAYARIYLHPDVFTRATYLAIHHRHTHVYVRIHICTYTYVYIYTYLHPDIRRVVEQPHDLVLLLPLGPVERRVAGLQPYVHMYETARSPSIYNQTLGPVARVCYLWCIGRSYIGLRWLHPVPEVRVRARG